MSRLIDADRVEFLIKCCKTYHGVIALDTVMAILRDVPTIDAVEVVRCKECTERDDDWCMYFGKMINPDDFCSYGERSEK